MTQGPPIKASLFSLILGPTLLCDFSIVTYVHEPRLLSLIMEIILKILKCRIFYSPLQCTYGYCLTQKKEIWNNDNDKSTRQKTNERC